MTTKAKTDTELRDAVLEAYQETGDSVSAVASLANRWFSDRRFRKLAEQKIVYEGFAATLSHLLTTIRGAATNNGHKADDDSVMALLQQRGMAGLENAGRSHAAQTASAIFYYPLYGGQPLGTATKPEILASVEQRSKQAAGHAKAARREAFVAEALPDDSTQVQDCLTAEKIEELFEQAEE